jgi:Tfp pilus assembly protein PilW
MSFLTDRRGLSLVEYVVGGAIALIVLAASVWGIAKSTEAQGDATSAAVDDLPAMPAWP